MKPLRGDPDHAGPARDLCDDPDNGCFGERDPGLENVLVGFRLKQPAAGRAGAPDRRPLALQEQDALRRGPLASSLHDVRSAVFAFFILRPWVLEMLTRGRFVFNPMGITGALLVLLAFLLWFEGVSLFMKLRSQKSGPVQARTGTRRRVDRALKLPAFQDNVLGDSIILKTLSGIHFNGLRLYDLFDHHSVLLQ